MSILTLLDAAHAAVSASPEDEGARLRFYERLADGEMFLLLEREVEGDRIEPRIFDLEDGPVVLCFDREERLADFSGGIAPYAAMPGRVVAALLTGRGIGLGVNLGVAPSSMLLPPEAMDWLARTLEEEPEEVLAAPSRFVAPAVPAAVVAVLEERLARSAGLAAAAVLCGVVYGDGRRGHMLAFLDAAPGAEGALAGAIREALVFSGVEAAELDVAFLSSSEGPVAAMGRVGRLFDLTRPEPPAAPVPAAPVPPGSDPSRPPRLR